MVGPARKRQGLQFVQLTRMSVSQAGRGGGGDVAATQAKLTNQSHRRSGRPRGKWLARSRQRGA